MDPMDVLGDPRLADPDHRGAAGLHDRGAGYWLLLGV